MNYYDASDHAALARFVRRNVHCPWVMTYDDVPEIRALYKDLRRLPLSLAYSARERRTGLEMLILKPDLTFPPAWRHGIALK